MVCFIVIIIPSYLKLELNNTILNFKCFLKLIQKITLFYLLKINSTIKKVLRFKKITTFVDFWTIFISKIKYLTLNILKITKNVKELFCTYEFEKGTTGKQIYGRATAIKTS